MRAPQNLDATLASAASAPAPTPTIVFQPPQVQPPNPPDVQHVMTVNMPQQEQPPTLPDDVRRSHGYRTHMPSSYLPAGSNYYGPTSGAAASSLSPYAAPYVPSAPAYQPYVPPVSAYQTYTPSIQGPYDNPGVRASYDGGLPQGGGRVLQQPQMVHPHAQQAAPPVNLTYRSNNSDGSVAQPQVYNTQPPQNVDYRSNVPTHTGPGYHGYQYQQQQQPVYPALRPEHIILNSERISRKSARSTMDRIAKELKKSDNDESVYAGVCIGADYKLTRHNDAVFFVDALAKKMSMADGRVWGFPMDQLCADGTVRPIPDEGTPYRVELFSRLIPQSSATRAMMTPKSMINTYLINGGRYQVPYEMVTITDWARILVAEAAATPASKNVARRATDGINLEAGEAWTHASTRLLLHIRAREANPDRPFTSESDFFWRFVSAGTLIDVVDRTLRMLLPKPRDHMSMDGYAISIIRDIKNACSSQQVDYNYPLSLDMAARGKKMRELHSEFIQDLSNRTHMYLSAQELLQTQRAPGGRRDHLNVGALSNRRVIGGSYDDGLRTMRQSSGMTRKSLIGALRGGSLNPKHAEAFSQVVACLDSGDSEAASFEPFDAGDRDRQLAAFDNRAASKPGATGTPYQPTKSRKLSTPEQSLRPSKLRRTESGERSKTFADGKTPADERGLPHPSSDRRLIYDALGKLRVCFFHAEGFRCPHNGGGKRCRFSHDSNVVPVGMYAPPEAMDPKEACNIAMLEAYNNNIDGESVDTSATEIDTDDDHA